MLRLGVPAGPQRACIILPSNFDRPIQKSLKDSTVGGMNRVLYVGLAFCAALYGTVAISGACSG